MTVDIIICTYNRAKKLRATIQSILDTEVPQNNKVRLIVVNNNSTDDTDNVLREFLSNDLKVEINYLFEAKQGKSNALNKAIRNIAGDLIAFTDDDITVDKMWIREMINAFYRYPQYKCFGGKVKALYPENMPKWFDINSSMKFLRSAFGDRDEGDSDVEYGTGTISKAPGGGNMFFRK